jgi:glutamate dehydrogenase
VECYRIFIRGLLDVTDNLVKGEITHPPGVVRHDDPDPYLVVAADKGTATFSDYANELSEAYGFWLGDAFASGGSNGYDHKGMGITAKGGWESVKRHFRELGVDCQREEHTAVGVGDMAGDVFGNGMLLSKKTRLVAAFNHLHIFIDPDPDTDAAYKERQRLFRKAGGWDQYDTSKISRGGGVWERSAKSIKLPKEARAALGIEAEELAPYEIVAAILRAPVDLLWLGGIGTYIKGGAERDEEIGDRANRLVRCNGADLRCRVVGEGANLGCTQPGRVEFALAGGYINTDFIDNSAGVDCSDHEVNIKILLNAAVDAKKLSRTDRNKQLADMTDEVGSLVLRNNYLQTQAISMMSAFTVKRLGTKAHFISWLENRGVLDRNLEHLPNPEEIEERRSTEQGLTRPELAVLLSYAKIKLYPELLESDVPEDPYLARELVQYFPTPLREKYQRYMNQHRVWREIIATQVTNDVINRMGATFIMRMQEDTSAYPPEIARAYTIAREVFDAPSLWAEIEGLDNQVSSDVQTGLLLRLWELLRHATRWLLNLPGHVTDVAAMVDAYQPGVRALVEHLRHSEVTTWRGEVDRVAAELRDQGVPEQLASRVAVIDALYPALDIVDVANQMRRKVEKVGWIYARLGSHFGLRWLRRQIEHLPVDGMWHANARGSLRDQLYEQHRALTVRVIQAKPKHEADAAVDVWLEENEKDAGRVFAMMTDMQRLPRLDYATAIVALRALEQMNLETSEVTSVSA